MDPELVVNTVWTALNGKNVDGGGAEPVDSPLKVWTGSEWVSTGVSVIAPP